MSYIDHITEFLFDENRRLSSKAAVVVFAIIAIFVVDNVLGFSYYFSNNKKIEQVQKLNSIIQDTTSDSTTKTFAKELRTEIIDRKNVFYQAASFFRNIRWTNSKKQTTPVQTQPSDNKNLISKSNFWFHLTAGGLWYLLAVLMIPVIVFTDKKTSLPQRIATGIFATALFFGFGWLFYWLCSLIPQITSTTWIWNYIINFILQLLFVGLLVAAGEKKK
ncbi:MAG: hypothetical protein WAT19_09150 [Ferruginibacter sp.]